MTDNIIRPKQFRHKRMMVNSGLSNGSLLNLYSALLNLYHSANTGCTSNGRLVAEMVKHPEGMNGPDTMSCAAVISNNVIMMEKLRDCIGEMMKYLVLESAQGLDMAAFHSMTVQNMAAIIPPDDQPPAA